MEFDPGRINPEARSEQATAILRAEQQVTRHIWKRVPGYSAVAFETLETLFESGADIGTFEFWSKYQELVRRSFRAFWAKARQTLVEDAFAELLEKTSEGEKRQITIPLFANTDSPQEHQPEGTILEAYKYAGLVRSQAMGNVHDQARIDILQTLTLIDPFARSGLFRPDGSYYLSIIGTDKSHSFRTPTIIDGVSIRFEQPQGQTISSMELVTD